MAFACSGPRRRVLSAPVATPGITGFRPARIMPACQPAWMGDLNTELIIYSSTQAALC